MTSKEALETLFEILCEREHTNSEHNFWLKLFNDVAKDLEVLDILKRLDWLLFNNVDKNDFNYYIDFNKSMKLTNEEAVKIKEWLNIKEEWGQYE